MGIRPLAHSYKILDKITMRIFLITGSVLLLSGCMLSSAKTMTNDELTECAASSAILKNEVACAEELEKRNAARPKSQNNKTQRVVNSHEQESVGRILTGA